MTARPLVLAAALAVFGAGCTTVQPGAKTVYTLKRHLNTWEAVVASPIGDVHRATVAGLNDLSLQPFSNGADKLTGLVDGLLADGTDYEVHLEALSDSTTRLRVRCGMFGDQALSMQLFRAIEKHL